MFSSPKMFKQELSMGGDVLKDVQVPDGSLDSVAHYTPCHQSVFNKYY